MEKSPPRKRRRDEDTEVSFRSRTEGQSRGASRDVLDTSTEDSDGQSSQSSHARSGDQKSDQPSQPLPRDTDREPSTSTVQDPGSE